MTTTIQVSDLVSLAEKFETFLIHRDVLDGALDQASAVAALKQLTGLSKAVVLLDDSPRRSQGLIERLEQDGIPRDTYSAYISAGEATWHGLRTGAFGPPFESGGRVFTVGAEPGDLEGLDLQAVARPDAADFILLCGRVDAPAEFRDLLGRLALAATQHVPTLCVDPTRTDDRADRSAATLAAHYEGLGGKVTYVGAPYTALYRAAAKIAGGHSGQVICVGTNPRRDLPGAEAAGYSTALFGAEARDMSGTPHQPTYFLSGLTR